MAIRDCGTFLNFPARVENSRGAKDAVKKNWPGSAGAVAPDPYAMGRRCRARCGDAIAMAMPPVVVREPS